MASSVAVWNLCHCLMASSVAASCLSPPVGDHTLYKADGPLCRSLRCVLDIVFAAAHLRSHQLPCLLDLVLLGVGAVARGSAPHCACSGTRGSAHAEARASTDRGRDGDAEAEGEEGQRQATRSPDGTPGCQAS